MRAKILLSAIALSASASYINAEPLNISGLIITLNSASNSIGLENIPGALNLINNASAITSNISQSVLPLTNDIPVVGLVVGSAVPVVTQLSILALPAVTGLPTDTSGLENLLSTDIAALLETLIPGNYTFSQTLPGLQ
jgi:hypothetical protein